MNEQESWFGDSGGPWFYNKKAYGIHGGALEIAGQWWDYFSSLAYLDEALDNVTIKTS